MTKPLIITTIVFALVSVLFFGIAVWSLKKKRIVGTAGHTLLGLLLLSISALFATLTLSTQGYRALTREEVAAVITTRRLDPQRFQATVRFLDGRDTTFLLLGDEFYVDAHILKWKPIANILGLHTDYELDRISGRYAELASEQTEPRTVFALSREKPLDLFHLRRRHPLLGALVDAEYGSGTFIATDDTMEFEVRVSTSGLLVRKKTASPR